MRTYEQLTDEEKSKALDQELNALLGHVIEGSIRFDDEKNDDNLQAVITAASEEANRRQTPWFAGEYIMDAKYTVDKAGGYEASVGDNLRGMAQCTVEDALYPGTTETIIRL